MVDAIQNNTANVPSEVNDRSRKATTPNVGLITPPNKNVKLLPDNVIKSSSTVALNTDKFDKNEKNYELSNSTKTPIGVKVIFAILGAVALGFGLKHYGSKLLNLFKGK